MRCRSLTPPLQWVWFRSSSVVEQPAVNRRAVGSNPTCGAICSYEIGRICLHFPHNLPHIQRARIPGTCPYGYCTFCPVLPRTYAITSGDTDRPAASTNTMSRFETEVLTQDGNVEGLDRLNAKWVDGAMSRTPHRRVILDMDSSESPVHGEQERASYNGHFGSTCYHPLFVFNQFGDCEGAMLRAGNVHSAHRWRDVLDPILSRYGATGVRRYFRADAAFAKPDIYEYLEERRVFYAIRLPSNKVLQYEIAPLLIRPVGRPPKRPVILYDDFWYRAESWDRARRVVAKVEWHRGELFPRVGFIVTNMMAGPEGVVRFYNGRGTAEQWVKEEKYALNWTRLSCHRFVANRVRLSVFVLAYNLGNFLRRLCLPKAVKHWSLRSVQVKLIKMGGRLVRHSRWLIFQLSEVSVPRRLFEGVLDRIGRLSPAPS